MSVAVPGQLTRVGGALPRPSAGTGRIMDHAYRRLLASMGILVFVLAALIVFEMWRGALPAMQTFGWKFLVTTDWDPVAEKFGALPYLFGTLASSALALLFAVPLGLGTAIALAEILPARVGDAISFLVELLASIPSIVYGIWGVFVLAPWLRTVIEPWLIAKLGWSPLFQGFPFGLGMLNAGIVLAIMIVPTIISLSREVLLSTPKMLREAAFGLGATRAEAIAVTVDAARPGILGAVILGARTRAR